MSRLCILLLNSARRWIGEAAHTVALAQGLEGRGHRVVVGLRGGYEPEERARAAGLEVQAFQMRSRFSPLAEWSDCSRLRRILRTDQVDLVHCNRGKDHWLAAGACFLRRPRVPIVRGRHVVVPVKRHLLNLWLYRYATHGLLSVSRAARDSLGGLTRLTQAGAERPAAIDRIIHSSVDSSLFHPGRRSDAVRRRVGCAPDTVLIGLVARIQRIKGQREFLRAAAQVVHKVPNVRFLLAGRGREEQVRSLLDFAESVGLPRDSIEIQGFLPDLPDVMAALDIGAVASLGSEGSSRVALEYMASGLPIVATRVGGIPELVDDPGVGFLIEPGDVDAMAERLRRLVLDPDLRRRMGATGRHAALERHNVERWLDEVETLYRDVLATTTNLNHI